MKWILLGGFFFCESARSLLLFTQVFKSWYFQHVVMRANRKRNHVLSKTALKAGKPQGGINHEVHIVN